MAKPVMLIRGPVGTRSGYGDMARDICRHLINIDKWDIKIWACPWGATPMNALTHDHPKDKPIVDRIIANSGMSRQPEIFVTITVPNEFQPLGKYNIGITAGIETTACDPKWIESMNQMDVTFTISEHSKKVLSGTAYEKKDDLFSLFWKMVNKADSSKIANLSKQELGMLNLPVRDCQKIALLALTHSI